MHSRRSGAIIGVSATPPPPATPFASCWPIAAGLASSTSPGPSDHGERVGARPTRAWSSPRRPPRRPRRAGVEGLRCRGRGARAPGSWIVAACGALQTSPPSRCATAPRSVAPRPLRPCGRRRRGRCVPPDGHRSGARACRLCGEQHHRRARCRGVRSRVAVHPRRGVGQAAASRATGDRRGTALVPATVPLLVLTLAVASAVGASWMKTAA